MKRNLDAVERRQPDQPETITAQLAGVWQVLATLDVVLNQGDEQIVRRSARILLTAAS